MTRDFESLYFILGAEDLEMFYIKNLLRNFDMKYINGLTKDLKRCSGGHAYNIFPIHKHPDLESLSPVFVECRPYPNYPINATIIDHHVPSVEHYYYPPDKFFHASSLGQIYCCLNLLDEEDIVYDTEKNKWFNNKTGVEINRDWILTTAYDHCFPRALKGECPGVSEREIFEFRNKTKADYRRVPLEVIKNELNIHISAICASRTLNLAGRTVYLCNHLHIPDLYEVAVMGKLSVIKIIENPVEEGRKIMNYTLVTLDDELLNMFGKAELFGEMDKIEVDWNRCTGRAFRKI